MNSHPPTSHGFSQQLLNYCAKTARAGWRPASEAMYGLRCVDHWPGQENSLEAGFQIGLVEAELLGLFQCIGAEAHRAIFADDFSVRTLVQIFELEQFLGDDDLALHADHFGDVGRAARTVTEALYLDDEV